MVTARELRDRPITLTFGEWEQAKQLADERMKASNGHYFVITLKTRCQHCGRSPRAKGRCGGWFQTFLAQLDTVLLNLEREFAPVPVDVPVSVP